MGLWDSFKKKIDETWSGADFWDEDENRQQREQFAQQRQAQAQPQQPQQVQAPQGPVFTNDFSQPGAMQNPQSPTVGLEALDFSNKQQPVQQAPQPQQPTTPPPKQSVWDKLRDIPDANTPADQWRRQQEGRPAIEENPGNIATAVAGGTARVLNTAAAQVPQAYYTGEMLLADITGNTEAWRNANQSAEIANDQFKNGGGLFNAGTLYNAEEARRGDLVTGVKRIGGGSLEAAAELASLGLGSTAGKAIVKQGIVQGVKTSGKNIATNAGVNAVQSGAGAFRQDASITDTAKAAAVGGVLGPALDTGLGVAGGVVTKNLSKASIPDILNKTLAKGDDAAEEINFDGGKMRIREKFSPDRQIRKVTNAAEEAINKMGYKALVSENPIVRTTARAAKGMFGEFGTPEELATAKRQLLLGGTESAKVESNQVLKEVSKSIDDLGGDAGTRIWASLDPDQAAKKGLTVSPDELTPEERVVFDRVQAVQDEVTAGNLTRGFINEDQAAKPYFTRRYTPFEESPEYSAAYKDAKGGLLKSLKGRKDVDTELLDEAITDPAYLVSKRMGESQQAWAMSDYSNFLADKGYIFDQGRKGLVQLPDSKLYGKAAGKFVPQGIAEDFTGFQYQWGVINSLNDVLNAYDRLGVRQAKKQLLTVFNPAVRLGNQLSNRVVFSTLNGINPVEFNKVMLGTRKLMKNNDPIYKEAVRQGIIGTDLTNAEFTSRIASYVDDPNIVKQASDWVRKSYSEADDRAKLAAFQIHMKQGYSAVEAARLTQRGFQDYSSVGFFYDMAAKFPVVGNAFVRFAGDATRIMKNAAIDHPLRTMGTVGLWTVFKNGMSRLSGETPEEQQVREDRFGTPKIPFTDTSLAVQTPWGEVNLARFMPFYQLNDAQSSVSKFLPIQGNPLKSSGWNDPLLGQVAQLFTDKDFRGKSIQDPNNNIYYEDGENSVKKFTELSGEDKVNNVLRFMFTQNAPLGKEADAIISAATDNPDIYGKDRSVTQAMLRAAGVKIEEFGPEQVEKQKNLDKFFDGNVKRVTEFIEKNPDLAESYYKFNNPTRNRDTDEKHSDLITPERWKIIGTDNTGRLFKFLQNEALEGEKEGGKPVDPIFKLDDDKARELIQLRSVPTGDDIEREEILRQTTDWYKKFEKDERDYYAKNEDYWAKLGLPPSKQNPRVKQYGETYDKFYPKDTKLQEQYYATKKQSEEAGKAFYKANADQLSADFDAYSKQKLKYINERRKIEGFEPLTEKVFENVTFGYEDDEDKVAKELYFKGKGGGKGKGGSGSKSVNIMPGDFGSTRSLTLPSVKIKPSKVNIKKPTKPKAVKIQRNKKPR